MRIVSKPYYVPIGPDEADLDRNKITDAVSSLRDTISTWFCGDCGSSGLFIGGVDCLVTDGTFIEATLEEVASPGFRVPDPDAETIRKWIEAEKRTYLASIECPNSLWDVRATHVFHVAVLLDGEFALSNAYPDWRPFERWL